MKRALVFVAVLSAALCVGCQKPVNDPVNEPDDTPGVVEPEVKLESISLDVTQCELAVGATQTLVLSLVPAGFSREGLSWSSSRPAVATVADGTVTAVAAGEAVITASLAGKSASCTVTVKAPVVPDTPKEWDGKTFYDRSAQWKTAFVNHGTYWTYEIENCSAAYHLIKYIMEDEDFLGASEAVRKSPVDIKAAYEYFCVNVDYDPYLVNAMTDRLPDAVELWLQTGYGYAQGYVFGFDKDKKFTGEYVHLTSETKF